LRSCQHVFEQILGKSAIGTPLLQNAHRDLSWIFAVHDY
jgi:hypothetical protein